MKTTYSLITFVIEMSVFVSLTTTALLVLLPLISAYPLPPPQARQAGGFQLDTAYQQYDSAVNVQPMLPVAAPAPVPAGRAAIGRQPQFRHRNDDYYDDPSSSSSSMFVLGMLAIVIGVPCFLCYSRKRMSFFYLLFT